MDWNEETIARLRQLWQEGHSTAEIGRRMGITKNAVVGKAHRLVLSPRPSPIRRNPEARHVSARSIARGAVGSTPVALSTAAALSVVTPPVTLPSAFAPRPLAEGRPVAAASGTAGTRTGMQLRAVPMPRSESRITTCCWPVGDPGTPSFRFCDDGAMTGKPYCAQHAALAYVKVRERREDAA